MVSTAPLQAAGVDNSDELWRGRQQGEVCGGWEVGKLDVSYVSYVSCRNLHDKSTLLMTDMRTSSS